MVGMSDVRIMRARRFHTMEPGFPTADAVAVRGDRILAVGSFDTVVAALGDVPYAIDDTLSEYVVLPGLIDQHLHPLTGAAALSMEIISTEDWVLPDHTATAAHSPQEYLARLQAAEQALTDAGGTEWLLTWGYHPLWHGPLDRSVLDQVSTTRPILVWHRSCHEVYLNTPAIETAGVTKEWLATQTGHGTAQIDIDAGRSWESGFMDLVVTRVAPYMLPRTKLEQGLHLLVDYLHHHGVTAINEPGLILAVEPTDLYQQILGADDTPFTSTFLVDGRGQVAAGMDPSEVVADAAALIARAPSGKVHLLDRHVKLFADGAIISQRMQMLEPYLDDDGAPDPSHHGEWIIEPEVLERYYRAYWDAGWQVSTHVTGDLGLQVLLDVIERCMVATPRRDHRCVIVHFSNATEEQVDRIARLGCVVSANPYYPVGFADRFGQHGVGPERADVMVRSRSALQRNIPLAFHSDLPMAPAEPLFLAWCGATRRTESGRVAAPEQRVSIDEALRAVTIGAAYTWRMEHEIGSIAPGKAATFTVLGTDPYEGSADDLKDHTVVGTVYQGRWFPVPPQKRRDVTGHTAHVVALPGSALPAGPTDHTTEHDAACTCEVSRALSKACADLWRAAG
jgi:predicted amidohydrolase YtcJ